MSHYSQAPLAPISYLGSDQRSEMEAFRNNFACHSQCHEDANSCLVKNASWRKQPIEAVKDCMADFSQCRNLCTGF